MPNILAHFAIEADDVSRARAFYESVFGWAFEPWGPPDFYLIDKAGVHGALQQRREPASKGRGGFQLSFAVDDLDASMKAIAKAGGVLLGTRHAIPMVGEMIEFRDTEGNAAIIIQYTPARLAELPNAPR
jgi:predicted enzyme related to lactoylglutathione lyase